MATDDDARCWQSARRCILLFFFLACCVCVCVFFLYISNHLIKGCAKLFVTLVKDFCCTHREASSCSHAGLRHACICKAPQRLMFGFVFFPPPHARFQHENAKWFGNLLPAGAFTQGSRIELSSARMFDAASVLEHMPHSVLVRLFAHEVFFFFLPPLSKLLLWPWGGRAGQGQQLSARLEAL